MEFQGFTSPFTTPVPDQFFDLLLARIDSLAELKVVLYVLRRTFGFGKLVDRISYSQFSEGIRVRRGEEERQLDEGTGLSPPSVSDGLRRALAHGYLVRYVVCPRCDQEVSQLQRSRHQGRVGDAVPHTCPHCGQRLRRRAHFYYAVPLRTTRLSTQLSTPGKDLDYQYLKSFTRGSKGFIPALLKLLKTQETDKQETVKQETVEQETEKQETNNNKQNVVAALSAFGFEEDESHAIAEEALKAGLTADDVQSWIEYARRQNNLTNPKGFLRSRLRRGQTPPSEEPARYRYVRGAYADYIKH